MNLAKMPHNPETIQNLAHNPEIALQVRLGWVLQNPPENVSLS